MVLLGGMLGFMWGGVCGFIWGGIHGFIWGVCMVLFGGGMHGFMWGGVCMVLFRGVCMVFFSVFSDTMRYGQLAGGTHPTGMHSCSYIFFVGK